MVGRVLDNVLPLAPGDFLVATKGTVGGRTKGAVDTILKAYEVYDEGDWSGPLVVANCDQLIILPPEPTMKGDGVIFTFKSGNPAHSYVLTPMETGDRIEAIVEKPDVPPSDRAVSGVYWFKEAGPFLEACRQVDHEGELYVSSALQVMLNQGYSLYAEDVPTAILGTPEDFQRMEVAMAVIGQ